MCVIVYKPAGIDIKLDTIQDMYDTNPDGFGLAYFGRYGIQVVKGLWKPQRIHAELSRLVDVDVACHFRWATHGLISTAQCHPIAISDTESGAKMLRGKCCKACILHNGIVTGYGTNRLSDTIDLTVSVLSNVADDATRIRILELIDSKWIYMSWRNKSITRIGKFEDYYGLSVSNTYFDNVKYYLRPQKQGTHTTADNAYYDADYPTDIIPPAASSKIRRMQ